MDITLEQARVFESVARLGTIQKAAAELHRGHSAVLYSLKGLEEKTGLSLFDRAGYRNRITPSGQVVLKYCEKLLSVQRELADTCRMISGGWEPSLKLIYDEVVDFNLIGRALFRLNEMRPPTEVKVLSAHLDEVERNFLEENADMMVTVLPFEKLLLQSHRLAPIRMHLVAHRLHPLSQGDRAKLTFADLNRHTFITIKTSPGEVALSTEKMDFDSYFFVKGFMTKKLAIMNRLGFGWLPDYLIADEILKGSLRLLRTEVKNTGTVRPRLYHRPEEQMGKASLELLRFLKAEK